MDVNLALVSGRLAVPPDLELLSDGSRRAHLLVHVRSERRGRFDVLPVSVPADVHTERLASSPSGARIFVAGPLMRRCSPHAPPGRIEVIAAAIGFPDLDGSELRCT